MPPPMRRGKFEKPKDAKGTFLRLIKYLGQYRFRLVVIAISLIVSSYASTRAVMYLKPILNTLGEMLGEGQARDIGRIVTPLLSMLVIYMVSALLSYVSSRLLLTISTGALNNIRKEMFDHMQDLPIGYFDARTHGEIMSRYTNDTDAIRSFLSQSLSSTLSSTVSLITTFVYMIIISPLLTLIAVALLPLMTVILKKVAGKSGSYFIAQQKAVGAVNGYIEEAIEGQKVVQVFCHQPQTKQEFDALNEELCHAGTNANTYASILGPIMNNISHIHYVVTAIAGALLGTDVGALVAFLTYTRQFAQPISQISQQFNGILVALAGAERVFEVMDVPVEADEGYVTLVNAKKDASGALTACDERTGLWAWRHPHQDGTVSLIELRGDVVFEDVTFGYVPEKTVLHDISLYAKPGQKIAFVGATGAGKTTITNLINRFYDIQEGKIRYDGINIEKIKKDDLRRSLAMVLQDTHLFTGTVRENIRYGKLDATDEDVVRAAKIANAHFFIDHLPQGYDTLITGDGASLSQGQRQLLAIARAAIADPPVLILDEATSSIDTRTEALIERGMDELMKDRTVFVIAHRLSTVRNSQAIMVLENGEIIERGDHETLIAEHGKYYQLYMGMFELS